MLAALLPILDDLDRAREHGDLVGPFAAVAEQLTAVLGKFGLDGVRREGRPVRPDPARGGRAPDLGRRDRADLRRGHAPRLPAGERLLRPALVARGRSGVTMVVRRPLTAGLAEEEVDA